MATLELLSHHAIQMHDPRRRNHRNGGEDHEDHNKKFAPEAPAGSGH
jgi:hypothetical protein